MITNLQKTRTPPVIQFDKSGIISARLVYKKPRRTSQRVSARLIQQQYKIRIKPIISAKD